MTVIAWDGKTLAADKRAVTYGRVSTVTKIFRESRQGIEFLIGLSGCLPRAIAMRHWWRRGEHEPEFPRQDGTDDWACLTVITSAGAVLRYESVAFPLEINPGMAAAGGGRDYALMAMHLGMNAHEAVRLTCQLSHDCGNGIDTLTFS